MIYFEQQYYEALQGTLKENLRVAGRNGVITIKRQKPAHFEINLLREGLPILRGKKMFPLKPFIELVWMLQGKNDLDFLRKYGVNYWDMFDIGDGTIGNSYGPRLRNFNGFDQLAKAIELLQTDPTSRRIALSFWNPTDDDNSVVPCYSFIQFKVINNFINAYVTQRSGDAFIGVPNDALLFSYLVSLLSYITGLYVGTVYYTINDFHIYEDHLPAINTYLNQYEGWFTLYNKVSPFLSLDFQAYEGRASADINELLNVFVETGFNLTYNFKPYKSNPYIKAKVIK